MTYAQQGKFMKSQVVGNFGWDFLGKPMLITDSTDIYPEGFEESMPMPKFSELFHKTVDDIAGSVDINIIKDLLKRSGVDFFEVRTFSSSRVPLEDSVRESSLYAEGLTNETTPQYVSGKIVGHELIHLCLQSVKIEGLGWRSAVWSDEPTYGTSARHAVYYCQHEPKCLSSCHILSLSSYDPNRSGCSKFIERYASSQLDGVKEKMYEAFGIQKWSGEVRRKPALFGQRV